MSSPTQNMGTKDEDRGKHLLTRLDLAIRDAERYERVNRYSMIFSNFVVWLIRLLLLAVSVIQLSVFNTDPPHFWIVATIATLSMLNIAWPWLVEKYKMQQRQEVYDSDTRLYKCIKLRYQSGRISLDEAIDQFTEIFQENTERRIRNLP